MLNTITQTTSDLTKVLTLAGITFMGGSTLPVSGQEAPSKAALSGKHSAAKLDIPQDIRTEARAKMIPLDALKFENNQWSACISRPGAPASCIILGNKNDTIATPTISVQRLTGLKNGDTLVVNRYGEKAEEIQLAFAPDTSGSKENNLGAFTREQDQTFTFTLDVGIEARVTKKDGTANQVIDTLPRYKKEGDLLIRTKDLSLVNEYLEKHPNEDFLVLITVPALCSPCRALDEELSKVHQGSQAGLGATKTFVIEYFDFDSAKEEVVGPQGTFPTILTLKNEGKSQHTSPKVLGDMHGASIEQVIEPIQQNLHWRGSPLHIIRGSMKQDGLTKLIKVLKE